MASALNKGIIRRYNTFVYSSTTELELTMEQSGTIIFVDATDGEITFKLPVVTDNAGANFKFIGTGGSNNLILKQNESSGNLVNLLGQTASKNQSSNLTLGKVVECISNGSAWYVTALN
tara:strand:+ start:66 stop:422 length:357 start_codon:yes stop_codon:yes gene_type:complete